MTTLYGEWTVKIPGEEYKWCPDDMTVADQLLLDSELEGQTFDQWMSEIDERRAIPCQVLIWFLRHQNGRQEERRAVNFPLRRLITEQITAAEVEPNPEAPAGSEPATSSTPAGSTESDPGSSTDSPD